MKTLLEISDEDVGLEPKEDPQYKPRTTARAVIFKNNLIFSSSSSDFQINERESKY